MQLPEKGYKKTAVITFYIFLAILVTYLFFKYLFACVLPFAAAFMLAYASRGSVLFLCRKCRFSRFAAVLTVTLVVLGGVFALLYFLVSGLISELSGLTVYLSAENITELLTHVGDSVMALIRRLPPVVAERFSALVAPLTQNIDAFVSTAVQNALPVLASTVLRLFSSLPKILLFIGALILSLFYFGCDYEKITAFVKRRLSEKQLSFARELKEHFFDTFFSVLRAYGILIIMTFLELWVGFLLLRIPYATLLAIFIALVDILPVLGTGTVLVPWGVFLLIVGEYKTGLCILALYGIITVIRQVAEPKILGDSVGLHPLATLISMYFGLKLCGVGGLFLFPFAVMIITKVLSAKERTQKA